jgi:hypothetical protein
VQWRGHRHGGYGRGAAAAGIGFAAGALVGGAIASSNRGYYYNEPYAYSSGPYAYDSGYAPAPRYYNGGVNDYCARYDSSGVNRFDNCY